MGELAIDLLRDWHEAIWRGRFWRVMPTSVSTTCYYQVLKLERIFEF
jgi:hypothetical protein